MLLKPLKQALIDVTSFRFYKSLYLLSLPSKHSSNLGFLFPNLLGHRIYENKFRLRSALFFFLFSTSRIAISFPSTLKTFLCSSQQACCHFTSLLLTAEVEKKGATLGQKGSTVGIFALLGGTQRNLRCWTSWKSKYVFYSAAEAWIRELQWLWSLSTPGICMAPWKSRGLVFFRTRRRVNSQIRLPLGKLCRNAWFAVSLYPR